jgi:hypothetical protein
VKSRIPPINKESVLNHQTSEGILIHEKADDMPHLPVGPFTGSPGGKTIWGFECDSELRGEEGPLRISSDGGTTWESPGTFLPDSGLDSAPTGAFTCTERGTLVAAFSNKAGRANWDWDPELKDSPGARLPTCVVRSLDDGETWQDVQTLHEEWTGANRDIIQTSDGRLVFTSMKLRHQPGRHTCLTYFSDDDGKTWQPSNVIDLGGNGHHDGVTEATLVELEDGRLLKYMRTNWGQFWRALSEDGGEHWHPYGPSGVDASSAPGMLKRLASGRIALLWNRWCAEGEDDVELRGGDGMWSATPASNYREELSISFSEDECRSWSPPVVIARNEGSEVSYPVTYEAEPGILWITAHRWRLRMRIREADFLR